MLEGAIICECGWRPHSIYLTSKEQPIPKYFIICLNKKCKKETPWFLKPEKALNNWNRRKRMLDKCVNCKNWDTTPFDDTQGYRGRCPVLEEKLKISLSSSETVENTARVDYIFTPPSFGCPGFEAAMTPITLADLMKYRNHLSDISKEFYRASKRFSEEAVKKQFYDAMDEISKLKATMDIKIY